MSLESVNPASGELIKKYDETTSKEVEAALKRADIAFRAWRRTSYDHRAERLQKAAQVLDGEEEKYARLMTREMGKTIGEARSEVQKCAWVCRYYAEQTEAFLEPRWIETDALRSSVVFQPLGPVLAIMPWNFPFWQVFRFAAPGVMAGNVALLKHASNVSGCARAIEEIFRKAGFPGGVFQTLLVKSSAVGEILADPRIRAVTLTGSVPAGRAVAEEAGKRLKKSVMELGGSDPYIILEDADLEKAVKTCVDSRLINAGQSCIAAKRFIIVDAVRREFEELFLQEMRTRTMGDPMDEETDFGPQARRELRDELHGQVTRSLDMGAKLLLGGTIPEGPGAFYPATVLSEITPRMPAYEEELFGPVAALLSARDEEEAIRIANDSPFGLGAAVFTEDLERGEKIAAEKLEAGCCFVNALVKSDPRLPFGGVKESGYGRELADYGIREFVNIKTVYVG